MKGFTLAEIFESVLSALIYGGAFEVLCRILSIFSFALWAVVEAPIFSLREAIVKRRRKPTPSLFKSFLTLARELFCSIILIFKVTLFTLGFILLSYYSLDGELRLYMLILAFISRYLVSLLIPDRFITGVRNLVYRLVGRLCRFVGRIFNVIYTKICNFIKVNFNDHFHRKQRKISASNPPEKH